MLLIAMLLFSAGSLSAQTGSIDSLRQEVLKLDQKVNQMELNIELSQKKFRNGILIATIGYSVTIAGGLMLGRENDELGQVLLVAGGATGIFGTYKMVDAFRFLSGDKKKKKK
jgi:hypothetical protein